MDKKIKSEFGKDRPLTLALLISEFILNKLTNDEIIDRVKMIEAFDKGIGITRDEINIFREQVTTFLYATGYPKCKESCPIIKSCRVDKNIEVNKREYSLITGLLLSLRFTPTCISEYMNYIEELLNNSDLLESTGEGVGLREMCLGRNIYESPNIYNNPFSKDNDRN